MVLTLTHIKRSLALTLVLGVLALSSFLALEPTVTSAVTDSVVVNQTVTADITINSPADVSLRNLTSSIDTAVGSTTWTVTTNNSSGYQLTFHATNTPALNDSANGNSFTDYSGGDSWSVSSAYEFGFSAFGGDVSTYGSGSDCSSDQDPANSTLEWKGFNGTTTIAVATSSDVTSTSGSDTTLCVATEQAGVFAPSGSYEATVVATATTNP